MRTHLRITHSIDQRDSSGVTTAAASLASDDDDDDDDDRHVDGVGTKENLMMLTVNLGERSQQSKLADGAKWRNMQPAND